MRGIGAVLLVGILFLGMLPSSGSAIDAGVFVYHPPIAVRDKTHLGVGPLVNPVLGGTVSGSGTAGDPYVIEGWEFSVGAASTRLLTGIDIRDAQGVHLVIQNNYFHHLAGGIHLENVANVVVRDNVFDFVGTGIGIDFPSTSSVSIINNRFTDMTTGIRIMGSSIDRVKEIIIRGNTIEGGTNHQKGMDINTVSLLGIEHNTISGFETGIYCTSCSSASIRYNLVESNAVNGMELRFTDGPVQRNVIKDNGGGIYGHWPEIDLNENDIEGNVNYGFDLLSPNGQPVSATDNWWGAADGPSGEGPGSGDAVYDVLSSKYTPWLTDPSPLAGPGPRPVVTLTNPDESVPLTETFVAATPTSLHLRASTVSADPVASVSFWLDGRHQWTDTTAPFEFCCLHTGNMSPGTHLVEARALTVKDAEGVDALKVVVGHG